MARMKAEGYVAIPGLKQVNRKLKGLGPEWRKKLVAVNAKHAEPIAEDARQRAKKQGGVARRVAKTIKVGRGTGGATISLGNDKFPEAFGAEFGAYAYEQFEPWRGNQWTNEGGDGVGYFLHPAVRAGIDGFGKGLQSDLFDLVEEALTVKGSGD